MHCISIQQPFASLIAEGSKRREYRSWRTDYRGQLVICATAEKVWIEDELLPHGVAICTVDLVDCRKVKTGWAWHLKNPQPIVPVPVKGQQRIFTREIEIEYLPVGVDHIEYFNQTIKENKMAEFANYKNGQVTINTYRFPDAVVTDIEDICNAAKTESEEILVASIDTDEERDALSDFVD